MSEEIISGFAGLDTEQNQLDVEKGGLAVASNCAIERPGVLFPRRGLANDATMTGYKRVQRIWEFAGTTMVHLDDNGSERVGSISAGTLTALSSSTVNPDGQDFRLHETESSGVLFVATSLGIRRYAVAAAEDGFAGVPAMPDMDRGNSTMTDDSGGIIPAQGQRAYRSCLLYRPSAGPERIGAPSGRLVLWNDNAGGGSAQIPVVRVLLPVATNTTATALAAGNWWLQLFASGISDSATVDPGDEMNLINESLVTSAQITAGFVDITDVTPDAGDGLPLGGSALYINQTQGTAGAAKEPPPYAKCLGRYRNCLVAANIISRQYLEIAVLSVTAASGIQDGDTLTVECGANSFTLTGKTTLSTGPAVPSEYLIEAGGAASENIRLTTQNIVACINRHASNTSVYAFYAGIPDDPRTLGRFFIETRDVNASPINVNVGTGSATDCFEPQIPESGSAINSTEDVFENGFAISEPNEPDAFPPFRAGRMGAGAIVWISSLEDACFFWHDSGEVWMMSGETGFGADLGTLRLERKHTNLTLLAPFSAQVVDGRILALTDRGVIALSASGYEVVSRPIDTALRSAIATFTLATVRQKAFAVVHPSDRRYQLWLVTEGSSVCYELNLRTGAWTTRSGGSFVANISAGSHSPTDDLIHYGDARALSTAKTYTESNGQSSTTYEDPSSGEIDSTITFPPFVLDAGTRPKQLREIQVAFESSQPTTISATVTTENGAGSVVAVTSQATNLCRIPVPREVQRGVRHTVSLALTAFKSKWAISSVKLIYRAYESRGNR